MPATSTPASRMVRVGDFILLNAGIGATPTHGVVVVVANAGGVVDVTNVTTFGAVNSRLSPAAGAAGTLIPTRRPPPAPPGAPSRPPGHGSDRAETTLMPLTAVELCSAALVKLGAQPIASLDDAERRSRRRPTPLPDRPRRAAGRASWSFTLARPADARPEPPLADFGYGFPLPADHLRTISAGTGRRSRGLAYGCRAAAPQRTRRASPRLPAAGRRERAPGLLHPAPGHPAGGRVLHPAHRGLGPGRGSLPAGRARAAEGAPDRQPAGDAAGASRTSP